MCSMGSKGLTSGDKLELRIYRLLAVNEFRKAILWFEKVKCYGKDCKIENYHPSNFDIISLERYNGFLLYNVFLHTISLLFTIGYAFLSITLEFRNIVFDLGMFVLTLLNIYCIILQRSNYLKLKYLRYKYYKRFLKKTDFCREEILQKIYDLEPQKLQADYEVLSKIRKAFEGQMDCVLTCDDVESLKRICACFKSTSINKTNLKNKKELDVGLIENCNFTSGPYTALQIRADWLQRKLGVPGRKMLDCTAIITEDAECEKLYRELFHEDRIYNYCLVCFLLYEVFAGMISKVKMNES